MAEFSVDQQVSTSLVESRWGKVRSLFTCRQVWAYGISFLVSLGSCTSSPPSIEVSGNPSFVGLGTNEGDENNLERVGSLVSTEYGQFLHPKNIQPSTLKKLVMTAKKPPEEELMKCHSEIAAISRETSNESGLMIAKGKLYPDVNLNKLRYHWCFYYIVMMINTKLNTDDLGYTLRERMDQFHSEMKLLWILASALDQAFDDTTYFTYLQSRYLEISKTYFARQLVPKEGEDEQEQNYKPAGEFNGD